MGGILAKDPTHCVKAALCRGFIRSYRMKISPKQPAPLAKKHAHTQTRFGVMWTDDYAWMKLSLIHI